MHLLLKALNDAIKQCEIEAMIEWLELGNSKEYRCPFPADLWSSCPCLQMFSELTPTQWSPRREICADCCPCYAFNIKHVESVVREIVKNYSNSKEAKK